MQNKVKIFESKQGTICTPVEKVGLDMTNSIIDNEKNKLEQRLLSELDLGVKSAEENGWLSLEYVKRLFLMD